MAIATQRLRRVDSNSLLTVGTRPNAQDYVNLAATPDCDYTALEAKFWACNPTEDEVADFISQTKSPDTLARFWAAQPSARNIAYVMTCKTLNNPDTLARFWASKPTAEDILYAVEHLGVPVTEELVATFRNTNPNPNQRLRLEWLYINSKLPELAELFDPLRYEEEEEE